MASVVTAQNPAYDGRKKRFSTVLVDSTNETALTVTDTGTGKSNLVGSILLTILSVLLGNWCGLFCSIPAIIYALKARNAAEQGDKETSFASRKTAFAFIILSIITWIVTVCIAGFIAYAELCGPTGAKCDTRV